MLGSLATMSVFCWLTNARIGEKFARLNISKFYVVKIDHGVQMIVDIAGFTSKELFFVI